MRAVALALLVAACGSPKSPQPLRGSGSSAPGPASPSPTVTWIDNGFETPGLPAVARDGTLVAFGIKDNDGGRGYPNLRIVTATRDDRASVLFVVLTVDEVEKMFDDRGKTPALEGRMQEASRRLAKEHVRLALVAMTPLELDLGDLYQTSRATAGGIVLEWKSDRLTIKKGDATVLDRSTPPTWHAAPSGRCSNPSKLGGAWVDLERKVALVDIAYNGTDLCWEPSPQHHVVAW